MTPAEIASILSDARAVIASAERWRPGHLAVNATGEAVDPWSCDAVAWNRSGAIWKACEHRLDASGRNILATEREIGPLRYHEIAVLGTQQIGTWDEAPGRTHADVLDSFDRAIASAV